MSILHRLPPPLLATLAVAALLRLLQLLQHDVVTDEAYYAFRSLGLLDTVNAPDQPTPFEWFDPPPWWVHLSFHDHPPLGFWILHGFSRLFPDDLLGLRMVSVLAGLGVVFLTWRVAQHLFGDQRIALVAAAWIAVNACHVWFSRIAMQESLLIFFLMLATWLYLKTLDDERFFYATVTATGLALLVKYTAVVLLPLFLLHAAWRRRDLLEPKRLVAAAALLLVLLSPVLVYNALLFEARGHFDFQVSHLLGQEVADWQVRPGRDVGGLGQRLHDLPPRFFGAFGPITSSLAGVAVLVAIWRREPPGLAFVGLQLGLLVALLLVIGPQLWFLAMLAPSLALLTAPVLVAAAERWRWVGWAIPAVLLAEAGFALQSSIAVHPWGREEWTHSALHRESLPWGYNRLDDHLGTRMEGRFAALAFPLRYGFAEERNRRARERGRAEGRRPARVLFVIDSTLSRRASLWYFSRRQIYEGWALIDERLYLGALREDPGRFREQGFEEMIFVRGVDTLLDPHGDRRPGDRLEAALRARAVPRVEIERPGGGVAFRVYATRP